MESTPFSPPARPFWNLRSNGMLTRLLAFVLLSMALQFSAGWLAGWLGLPVPPTPANLQQLQATALPQLLAMVMRTLLPVVLAYWLLSHFIEARRMDELAPRKLLPHTAAGFLFGCGLLGSVVALLWLAGGYRIDGVNPTAPWFRMLLTIGVVPAVVEEIISRGVIYRILEQRFGSWVALIVSALLFGFLHAWNPNATLWSCLAIAIEAGLLLGIVFTLTRSLYVCMGLHAAWNFMEGPVLGTPVSGVDLHGLVIAALRGPVWLSGGSFGIEASVVTVTLMGAISASLMVRAQRRGLIRPSRQGGVRAPAPTGIGELASTSTSD